MLKKIIVGMSVACMLLLAACGPAATTTTTTVGDPTTTTGSDTTTTTTVGDTTTTVGDTTTTVDTEPTTGPSNNKTEIPPVDTDVKETLPATYSADLLNPMSGGADKEANAKREEITNTKDALKHTGTVYYISSLRGNDDNDGLSPATPWRTVDAYRGYQHAIKAGDSVLFERGGVYRCNGFSLKSGVTYAAYGSGTKPQIYGSDMNYVGEDMWVETEWENVWLCNEYLTGHVGNIVFNHGQAVGIMTTLTPDQLSKNFQYYHDLDNAQLYLYLEVNPSEEFYDIEMCEAGTLMQGTTVSNVTIDNLALKYGGSHGIQISNGSKNVKITNCEFGWIGGCYLTGTSRFGNAIEFWNSAADCLVENNWIYQVYDAGVTHQGGDNGGNEWSNITYRDNLIEYCIYAFEWFAGSTVDVMKNIIFEDNILRFTGYGWGMVRPNPQRDALICGWGDVVCDIENFQIRNNIFDLSTNFLIVQYHNADMNIQYSGNSWYQSKGFVADWEFSELLQCSDQATLEAAIAVIDSNPKVVKFLG